MTRSRHPRWITTVAVVALLLPGCGDTDDAADTTLVSTTTAATTTTTQAPTTTTTGATEDAEADVLATIEGFGAAVNAHVTEAIRECVTEDCTWQSTGSIQAPDAYLAHVDAYYEATNFHAEATSDPIVSLDGDEYAVVQQEAATFSGSNHVGTTTYRLVEVDGERLIRDVRWVEDATDATE